MNGLLGSGVLTAGLMLIGCSGNAHNRQSVVLARQCEVRYTLRGADEVQTRIEPLAASEGWLVALQLSVHLTAGDNSVAIRGLGRVVRDGNGLRCEIVDNHGDPATARFDETVCLDAIESLSDLLTEAEEAAGPGQTVTQEVQLRRTQRRRRRSAVISRVQFQERAEVVRDLQGRVVRLTRATQSGDQEEVVVAYPAGIAGRCLP